MNDHEHCGCGHDHAHGEACGCGHDHAHGEACGCGHDHAHGEACGCGHAHAHDHVDIAPVEDLSVLQQNFLLALYERKYLPVARFALRSSREDSIYAEALAPVYLGSPEDSMEQAKAWGAELSALAQGGLITLDYDMPLTGYAYQEYENAELYRYFQQTVREGSQTPGALFDTAALETGSMALTEAGRARVLEMLNEVE